MLNKTKQCLGQFRKINSKNWKVGKRVDLQLIPNTIMVYRRKLVHGNKKHKDKREHWLRRVGNNLRHAELEMFWGVRIEYSFKQQNLRGEKKKSLRWYLVCCVCTLIHVQFFSTLWIVTSQAPPSIGFSRQEYYSVHFQFSSVTQSCPTLQPHESKHTSSPCPLPTPGVHSDSPPLSQWCHPAISSSVIPFFSCPQSLPASESFPTS